MIFQNSSHLKKRNNFEESIKVYLLFYQNIKSKKKKKVNLFKKVAKGCSEAQQKIRITHVHGCITKEILKYGHAEYSLLEDGNYAKHNEHEVLNPLEKLLNT